ncbi:MAG: TatD family hydrolase [Elusimicrobia bacterium]|nr:TatD family hydrolase [Elusimicrobiota bacterium]
MEFIDTHAHLMDDIFRRDRNQVVERSFKSGVGRIVEIACSSMEWNRAVGFCGSYKNRICACFGIHPHYPEQLSPENIVKLKEFLNLEVSRGLGEVGLDYFWEPGKKDSQMKLLSEMIKISNEFKKICVFHCRNGKNAKNENAYSDLLDFIKQRWNFESKKRFRGVLHCFSGNYEDAKRGIDMGLAIGVNGTFTYPKNEELRETVEKIGMENIVFETDCPYLPPQSKRGKRNDPSCIPEIAGSVFQCLNAMPEHGAEIVARNSSEIFDIC